MNTNKTILPAAALLLIIGTVSKLHTREPRAEITIGAEHTLPGVPMKGTRLDVDLRQSTIHWKGTKMLRTGSHEGTIGLQEGFLLFENDLLVGGRIVADMNSIRVTDIPPHERSAIPNLTEHLESDFGTRTYPQATFEITDVRYLRGDSLRIRGNMTIRDVTKSILVPAVVNRSENNDHRFRSESTLNRFEWNVGADGSWLARRLVDADFGLRIRLVVGENLKAAQ